MVMQQPMPPQHSDGGETPPSLRPGTDDRDPKESPPACLSEESGLPSVVADYCQQALKNGHEECIWLCMKRGGRFIAKDIPLNTDECTVGLEDIRKRSSWWKRHSLYSAVGVKEVLVSSPYHCR